MLTKKTRNRLLAALGVLGVLLVGGVLTMSWLMKQPLYRFGAVSAEHGLRAPLEPPTQSSTESWQVESDIELQFDRFGEGRPVLVVHGGPGIPYAKAWKGLDPLTDRFQFYYYHQRGCGRSTRPFNRFSGNFYENMIELERTLGLGAQIADIERVRRILKQDKLILVGHSYGGFIASMYAAEFPDRVDKLVLVAPAGVLTPPDQDRDIFKMAREKLPVGQRPEYDKVTADYLDFGQLFSKSENDLVELQMRMGRYLLTAMGYDPNAADEGPRSGGWAVFALYFSNGLAQDFRPALAQVKAPTLILLGVDDAMSKAGTRSYEIIPDSTLQVIPREDQGRKAGHFVFDDCPAEFSKQVEAFIATQ